MKFNRFTEEALVWDEPVGPFEMDNVSKFVFLESEMLLETAVGHEVSEEVGSRCYLPVPLAYQSDVLRWVRNKQKIETENGTPRIEPDTVSDSQWWEYKNVDMIQVRDNVLIDEGVFTGDEKDDVQFFSVGDDILYDTGSSYVLSDTEYQSIGDAQFHDEFWIVNGYSNLSVNTDVWDELVEQGDVNALQPVIEANTGFNEMCRNPNVAFRQ